MSALAKFLIWSFFILIIDHTIILAASRYGLPVQPIGIYAIIAGGLFLVTVWIERGISPLKDARLFFLSFAALAVLGVIMYRGEGPGPDFGALVLASADTPSRIGYAVWPVLNLLASASLYLLARRDEYRRTIVNAAIVALLIQAAAMEIDMWQPAIFGGFPGRSSGFTQNANDAAFLMTALAALLLPAGSGERLHRFATYGVMIAFAAVLFSQSRTGFLCAVLLVAGLVVAARKASSLPKAHPAFVVSYIGVIVATLLLSPVLNVTDEQIMERNARHAEAAKRNVTGSPAKATPQNLGDPNFDKGVVTMKERIQARASIDSSVSLRFAAISFFSGIVKEHPFGLGTGFTNKFWTGPHNMWLKLATDEGIAAAILFTLMLGAACWQAVKTRSVVLLLMSAIALTASLFTQTVVVSPLIPALLAISMGMTQVSPQKRAMTFSEKHLASSLDQSLMAAIRRHYLALLLGPIIAALLFYALNPELPGMYVSKAYVRLDGANAESLSLERTNYAVTDLLLGGLPETKEKSIPTRAYHLMNFIELVDAEAPGSTATERLYRLEMTHKDPVVAQSINRQMLEGWLAKHPSLDRSIIVVAPDLPTKTARTSRALAAVFAGIAAAAVLLFVAGWKPLFRSLREWRYGLEWR